MKAITRRSMLGAMAAGTAALAAPATVRAQGNVRIRYAGFVQSEAEMKQLIAALNRYSERNTGVSIAPEFTNFSAFIDKLAAETSGGNAPDMFSGNVDIVTEYGLRGVIKPLTDYVPAKIDLSDYAQGAIKAVTVKDKLYAIPNDAIAPALFCRADSFKKAGIPTANADWTWEELAKVGKELVKANGPRFWGLEDSGSNYIPCEIYMRGRGKTLFTRDRQIGFTADDMAAWFAYWSKLRDEGIVPPADIQASVDAGNVTTFLIVKKRVAMVAALTDKIAGVQALVPDTEILPRMMPNGFDGGKMVQNHFIYAGNSTCVSAATPQADRVIDIIRFLHKDPEGIKLRYVGSGMIPASKAVRDDMLKLGDPVDARIVAYLADLQKQEAQPRAPGVVGMSNMLRRMNEGVAFKRITPQEAAAQFIDEAEKRLKS